MADYITRIRTADGDKQIDYRALANLPTSITDYTNTVISPNADYAEVGEWADGNTTNQDRLGYFVTVADVVDNTIKIRKATSHDDVRGVTVYNPAFSGNASDDKYGADGELLPQYNYVGIMGIVKIIDNGTCAVGGRCMPADDGTAIPSSNNMGYAVLSRVDSMHVLIAVEPAADMIQRVKTDIQNIKVDIDLPTATQKKDGLMSAEDKEKLDSVQAGANNYTLPSASANQLGGVIDIGATNVSISQGMITVKDYGHKHTIGNVDGLQEALNKKSEFSGSYNDLTDKPTTPTIMPIFANSVDECTDTSKLYVLPDGYIYSSEYVKTEGESAPFGVANRSALTTAYGSTKSAYSFIINGATIEGALKSITLNCGTGSVAITLAVAHMNGSVIESIDEIPLTTKYGENTYLNGDKFNYTGTIKVGDLIGFRMDVSAKIYYGTTSGTDVCITTTSLTDHSYSQKTYGFAISAFVGTEGKEGYEWVSTGHAFIDVDENVNISTFTLSNPAVKPFMASADYNEDYSYTNVSSYITDEGYRKDLPLPILLGWNHNHNAVEYAVTVGGKAYRTEHNRIAIHNLIPDTTYSYKVQALCANGNKETVETGTITTGKGTRMLNVDGIQNVRDVGGYAALNGKVKYGLIFRGSAMDEWIPEDRHITDIGKKELIKDIGVRTDLDLRGDTTASALGSGIYFRSVAYQPYTTAITDATQRGYFKTMFDYIVERLTNNQPIYIHCSGGCDRTGTLVFLLLGLLGVGESDLAKEYELSSFASLGKYRTRNSTVYDYSGMVTALKSYSGATITDKFVAFATACGIASDTINSFRTLMLG